MNANMKRAIRAGLTPPTPAPELERTDCTAVPNWAETITWREPNVREKKSKSTTRTNKTSGEFHAGASWKRDHPELFWKAPKSTRPVHRLVKKG